MSSLAEASTKEEQPQKPDEDEEQPAKKRARTDAAPVTDPEASDDAAPAVGDARVLHEPVDDDGPGTPVVEGRCPIERVFRLLVKPSQLSGPRMGIG